jgi:hypothetical protein
MGADREKNEQASLPTSGPSQFWCSHGMRAAAAAVRTDKGPATCRVVFTNYFSKSICRFFRANLMLLELLYNYHGCKTKYMKFGHTSVTVDILFKY